MKKLVYSAQFVTALSITPYWMVGVLTLGNCFFSWAAESPEAILKKADAIRNPEKTFVMKVEVSSRKGESHLFEVSTLGSDKTLIKTLMPKRDKGRNLLMLGESMWAYVPNLKRAVRVSLSQKVAGEAANGDISRMRWSGDYDVGIESEGKTSWTLFLKAKKKGLTYEKIRVVIEKASFKPLRAEYMTSAGKVFKKAEFKDYKNLAGNSRPSLITIYDAVRKGQASDIRILEMKLETLNETSFSLEHFQSQ